VDGVPRCDTARWVEADMSVNMGIPDMVAIKEEY
jgi:hypothetical protein